MKKHIMTQTEWENEMAEKIIQFLKSELYLDLPFLTIALSTLKEQTSETIHTLGTDGKYAYYSREDLLRLFQKNSKYLNRVYLHMVLHCIFFHLWIRDNRNKELWSLSCDICVEYTIDHMNKPSIQRILTLLRQKTYSEIEKLKGITASTIYLWLLDKEDKEIELLFKEFYCDDHRFWPKEEKDSPSFLENQNIWKKVARQTSMNQRRKNEKDKGENLLIQQIQNQRNKRSYKEFLKSFSVLKEEVHVDPDEFDLSYYTYGLKLYKNMPLIEPLESREVKKIREFVIVIDTSYSTNGQLVQNFLKETYTLLSQRDNFFSKSIVHIIQCDDKVRKDDVIDSYQQMEKLLHTFTLVGGNGTDFRPAFVYVNELIQEGCLKNLSGLLYFTDGKGIYPLKRPEYKTAFLFLDDYDQNKVPPWAICLKLDPWTLMGD